LLRLDVLNVFDSSYQFRDGTGVVAPQFGMRSNVFRHAANPECSGPQSDESAD
jgi:hypothetical protein